MHCTLLRCLSLLSLLAAGGALRPAGWRHRSMRSRLLQPRYVSCCAPAEEEEGSSGLFG